MPASLSLDRTQHLLELQLRIKEQGLDGWVHGATLDVTEVASQGPSSQAGRMVLRRRCELFGVPDAGGECSAKTLSVKSARPKVGGVSGGSPVLDFRHLIVAAARKQHGVLQAPNPLKMIRRERLATGEGLNPIPVQSPVGDELCRHEQVVQQLAELADREDLASEVLPELTQVVAGLIHQFGQLLDRGLRLLQHDRHRFPEDGTRTQLRSGLLAKRLRLGELALETLDLVGPWSTHEETFVELLRADRILAEAPRHIAKAREKLVD
mmetsp:Transcript_82436/g.214796  ORF Transcript_82436/g.214796 Transcript_82436/m.214796 type:complete len:267 (-) Transcript_82436:242-1042(-)